MILLVDKYDGKKRLLAKKGSKLTLIRTAGDVLLVSFKGENFSVRKEDVKL